MNAKRTAYHEAAHALIGWYYGFCLDTVTIKPFPEIPGVNGLCRRFSKFEGETRTINNPPALTKEEVYFSFAGRVADDLYFPKEPNGSAKDFEFILQMMPQDNTTLLMHEFDRKTNIIEDFYKRFKAPVKKILRSHKGKKALKSLSVALLNAGTITGAETVSILEKSWGKPLPVKAKPLNNHMALNNEGPKTYDDLLRSLEIYLAVMLKHIQPFRFDLEGAEGDHIGLLRSHLLIVKELLKKQPC